MRGELAISGVEIRSLKATRYYLQQQLGITIETFHRCINNCLCFVGNNALRRKCQFCATPRFEGENETDEEFFPDKLSYKDLKPRALYSYIPLIPRLKLLFANSDSAKKMRYPTSLIEDPWVADEPLDEGVRDIWEARAMRHWRECGYFGDERTVALHFSTDGVQLFRNSMTEVWPFLVLNLNLPPEER